MLRVAGKAARMLQDMVLQCTGCPVGGGPDAKWSDARYLDPDDRLRNPVFSQRTC